MINSGREWDWMDEKPSKESKKEIEFDSSMIFLAFAIIFFSLVFLGITINN